MIGSFSIGDVLERAWQIVWKHKILWVFGILASCSTGSGNGGGGGGGGNSGSDMPYNRGNLPPELRQFALQMERFGMWLENNWVWVLIVTVLVVLIIAIIVTILGTIGRIALIKGTLKAEEGAEKLGFGELWTASMPYFWRILLLSILVGVVAAAAALFVLAPTIVVSAITIVGLICILPLICIFMLFSIALGVVLQLAMTAIIKEELGIMDGLRRGWDVARANVGQLVLMALVLGIGSFIISVVISMPLLLALIPVFVMVVGNDMSNLTPLYIAGLCFVGWLPVLIVLQGILTAYVQTAWTLTYTRLAAPVMPVMTQDPPAPQVDAMNA